MEDIAALQVALSDIFQQDYLILCLGHSLRGDDAFGIILGERIRSLVDSDRIIIAENSPVNFIGKIAALDPDVILIIDAIDLGVSIGTVSLSDDQVVPHTNSTTTHYQELADLKKFLYMETGRNRQYQILGVQIGNTALFTQMHEKITTVINQLTSIFNELFVS
ncbi:MAG: hydrogenase maturation protease [Candidatus Heimdallarchaeota archaeon]|nr:hydrogenase maturation protease [Candidatus Heimdallarchaeota archaeon]